MSAPSPGASRASGAQGPLCVVYDGACPLCRGAARVGRTLDRRGATRWIASGDAAGLAAAGVPAHPAADLSVLVWDGGAAPLTETRALAAVVRRWPVAGRPLAALLARSGARGDRVYRWVARHRRRLPGRREGEGTRA